MLNSQKLLKKAPSFKKNIISIILSVIILLLILAFIPWVQTVSSMGTVTTLVPSEREQNISAPIGGRLGKWYVNEGSQVKKGQPIVQILDLDPELLSRIKEEKVAIEMSIKALQRSIEISEKNIKRHRYLTDKGASTERMYEQAKIEFYKYTQELAKQKIALAKVKVEIARQGSRMVKSPVNGMIVDRVHGVGGEIVKQTQVLASIIPDSQSRIVELWVSSIDIPLLKKGDKVMLQFEGWPAIQFSGWPEIAVGTFEGEISLIFPQNNLQGQFKIFVKPSGNRNWPLAKVLRLGTKVHAWVQLKDVSIGYELWRRYNGFPINVNSPDLLVTTKKA